MGFSEKLWNKKIQFQMQGPKTTKNMCKTCAKNTPPEKRFAFQKEPSQAKILPKSMWILWRKSPKNLNLCLIEGFFNMKHIQRTIYPVTSVLHNNHRDLCVPSLKLVRRHGPIFVAEIDQTALISGRIWPKILVRHGPDLKMLWELCIKDVVNNEELLMDKIW